MQDGLESQGSNILASQNLKHRQVEAVLQGQALRRSGHGGSGENKVTIGPLRLQEVPRSGRLAAFSCPCLRWRSTST